MEEAFLFLSAVALRFLTVSDKGNLYKHVMILELYTKYTVILTYESFLVAALSLTLVDRRLGSAL